MSVTPEPTTYTDVTPARESNALKSKLTGVTVSGTNYAGGSHTVPVRFVNPDFELATAEYPGVYISYAAVTRATDREVRGPAALQYAPSGYPTETVVRNMETGVDEPWADTGFDRSSSPYHLPDHPVPYNLDFNITVLTRNYQHAFEIITQLQDIERIPERFGHLEVPEDGTVRTLELLGGPETAPIKDESGKRVLQVLYSVRVTAELSLYEVQQVQRVMSVDIGLFDTAGNQYL